MKLKEWKGPESEKKGLGQVRPEAALLGGGVGAAVMKAGAKALSRMGSRMGTPSTGVGKVGKVSQLERHRAYQSTKDARKTGYDPRNSATAQGAAYERRYKDPASMSSGAMEKVRGLLKKEDDARSAAMYKTTRGSGYDPYNSRDNRRQTLRTMLQPRKK